MEKIGVRATDLQVTFDVFRRRQTEGNGSAPVEQKLEIRQRLTALEDELNHLSPLNMALRELARFV